MDPSGPMQIISLLMKNQNGGGVAQTPVSGGGSQPFGTPVYPGQHQVGYTPYTPSSGTSTTLPIQGGSGIPVGTPVNPSPRLSQPVGGSTSGVTSPPNNATNPPYGGYLPNSGTSAGGSSLAPWLDPNWKPGLPKSGTPSPRGKQSGW